MAVTGLTRVEMAQDYGMEGMEYDQEEMMGEEMYGMEGDDSQMPIG